MYKVGQEVYVVCNGWIIKKAYILKYARGLYTLEFKDNSSLTRLKKHRLYSNIYCAKRAIFKNRYLWKDNS